jgi:NTE family protein
MKKFALVLSGGGFKGAFQVGALEYIFSNPISIDGEKVEIKRFDIVSGVSVGSLNGAMIATNQFDELRHLWFEKIAKEGTDIIYKSKYIKDGVPKIDTVLKDLIPSMNLFEKVGVIFSKKKRSELVVKIFKNISELTSLADNSPLLATLKSYISLDKFNNTTYRMGYVSLKDGNYKTNRPTDFSSDEDLTKAILASTTMPIIWDPIEKINTKNEEIINSVDGGIRNITPLKDVIDEINNETNGNSVDYYIIVVNCSKTGLDQKDAKMNILSIASRSLLEITLEEILKNDIEQFLFINKILKQQNLSEISIEGKAYKSFKIKIIQPTHSIGETLDATEETLERRRKEGQRIAELVLKSGDWNV